MALGVDGAAARGALLAGKPCVGVLGTAIDVNYPAANSLLIDDVASAGAVISEFPPLYPTKPENFPRRNRIISGLSCGACIVEASVRSGALITANLALEQGRDVFAVPGNTDSPNSTGTQRAPRDGAKADHRRTRITFRSMKGSIPGQHPIRYGAVFPAEKSGKGIGFGKNRD